MSRHSLVGVTALLLSMAWHVRAAEAQSTHIGYHNGPVMRNVRIWPIYYGTPWTTPAGVTARNNQNAYLAALANYISGIGAPAGQSPTVRQYGVLSASAGGNFPVVPAAATMLNDSQIRSIISTQQAAHTVPNYASDVLIIVFPASGFTWNTCGQPGADGNCDNIVWRAYHHNVSSTGYYAVTFADQGSWPMNEISSHEIQEAATDPTLGAWNNGGDWEICDDKACGGSSAPVFTANGINILSCADNTRGGICPSSGFIVNPTAPSACGVVRSGEGLVAGTSQYHWNSCDGRSLLQMETTGQLSFYRDSFLMWKSPTVAPAVSGIVQGDGNLLVSRGFGNNAQETVWAANTFNQPGAYLAIQDDGNLVLYTYNGIPIWVYNSPAPSTSCGRFNSGQGLSQGTSLKSCDNRFNLLMQLDGNLVLRQGNTVLWASNTPGWGNLVMAVMQSDGNFVLYNRANSPPTALWATNTNTGAGNYFRIMNDGNLIVYNSSNVILWQSHTGGH